MYRWAESAIRVQGGTEICAPKRGSFLAVPLRSCGTSYPIRMSLPQRLKICWDELRPGRGSGHARTPPPESVSVDIGRSVRRTRSSSFSYIEMVIQKSAKTFRSPAITEKRTTARSKTCHPLTLPDFTEAYYVACPRLRIFRQPSVQGLIFEEIELLE